MIEVSRAPSRLMRILPNCMADVLVLRPRSLLCYLNLNEGRRRLDHVERVFIRLRATAIPLLPPHRHPSNFAYTRFFLTFFFFLHTIFILPGGSIPGGSAPQISEFCISSFCTSSLPKHHVVVLLIDHLLHRTSCMTGRHYFGAFVILRTLLFSVTVCLCAGTLYRKDLE